MRCRVYVGRECACVSQVLSVAQKVPLNTFKAILQIRAEYYDFKFSVYFLKRLLTVSSTSGF